MYKIFSAIDRVVGLDSVDAHCDIPCKIYDPSTAQIAALTVVRMIDLIDELAGHSDPSGPDYLNSMMRFVAAKEEHGVKCKEEIRVIWGDYFKQPQFEKHPEIHGLTHNIMMLASKCKQTVNREKGLELVEAVNQFSEIFWASKSVATKRAVCPYPPSLEVVYPDL